VARQNTTLHDVAERAGVSTATVSRVLRGIDPVADSTRDKVLQAADALNYRASHLGRALANRRHDSLGIVTPGLAGPYFPHVVEGFGNEALAARMSLIVLSTHLLHEADEQVLGLADRTDGLAIMGGTLSSALLRRLRSFDIPLVLVAQPQVDDLPTVRVDNWIGTKALVHHLIHDHGYRELAFVGTVAGNPDASERWQAFREAHLEAGVEPPPVPIPAPFSRNAGNRVVAYLRSLDHLPDALVCGNDEIAVGVMNALAANGLRVPDDIAVTGWDDNNFATLVTPALTTVHQSTNDLGAVAARLLVQLINQEDLTATEVILPSQLVVRGSCGCPTPSANPVTNSPGQAGGSEDLA
jgi:LacI family transcriptional regulator